MAVISHGLILALLPHGWIHHSPTDSSMDFDKSPSDFGEPNGFTYQAFDGLLLTKAEVCQALLCSLH